MRKIIGVIIAIWLTLGVLVATDKHVRQWILNYYRRCAMKIKNCLERIVMKLTDMCQKHVC